MFVYIFYLLVVTNRKIYKPIKNTQIMDIIRAVLNPDVINKLMEQIHKVNQEGSLADSLARSFHEAGFYFFSSNKPINERVNGPTDFLLYAQKPEDDPNSFLYRVQDGLGIPVLYMVSERYVRDDSREISHAFNQRIDLLRQRIARVRESLSDTIPDTDPETLIASLEGDLQRLHTLLYPSQPSYQFILRAVVDPRKESEYGPKLRESWQSGGIAKLLRHRFNDLGFSFNSSNFSSGISGLPSFLLLAEDKEQNPNHFLEDALSRLGFEGLYTVSEQYELRKP